MCLAVLGVPEAKPLRRRKACSQDGRGNCVLTELLSGACFLCAEFFADAWVQRYVVALQPQKMCYFLSVMFTAPFETSIYQQESPMAKGM